MKCSFLRKIDKLYNNVARQQALFTKLLPEDLQDCSKDYYLLYRIIDTAEDYVGDSILKERMLKSITADFLRGIKEASDLLLKNSQCIEKKYIELLENTDKILEFHNFLDKKDREAIESTGKIMAGGMLKFAEKFEKSKFDSKVFFINNFKELDEYCYFAAGCVGELNTKLFFDRECFNKNSNYDETVKNGEELGNYLQIVNILRDNSEDKTVQNKKYFPAENSTSEPETQLDKTINFAETKEKAIEKYINNIRCKKVKRYCSCLYDVAKEHLRFYRQNKTALLNRNIKPSSIKLFLILPLALKFIFLFYKIKKI